MNIMQYSSMFEQAIVILEKMGFSLKSIDPNDKLFIFKYADVNMFVGKGEEKNDIDLFCSIHMTGTVEEQKQILNDAQSMAEDDLKDFNTCYIDDGLAYIALFLRIKESRHKLYKKHLMSMIDKLVEGYTTLMAAMCIISYSQSPEFIKSLDNQV